MNLMLRQVLISSILMLLRQVLISSILIRSSSFSSFCCPNLKFLEIMAGHRKSNLTLSMHRNGRCHSCCERVLGLCKTREYDHVYIIAPENCAQKFQSNTFSASPQHADVMLEDITSTWGYYAEGFHLSPHLLPSSLIVDLASSFHFSTNSSHSPGGTCGVMKGGHRADKCKNRNLGSCCYKHCR